MSGRKIVSIYGIHVGDYIQSLVFDDGSLLDCDAEVVAVNSKAMIIKTVNDSGKEVTEWVNFDFVATVKFDG